MTFTTLMLTKLHKGREISNAVHMATLLMDIQDHKPVLQPPQRIHRDVEVQITENQSQICRGGISDEAVIAELQLFWAQYSLNTLLESLPDNNKAINLCLLQTSLKNLR